MSKEDAHLPRFTIRTNPALDLGRENLIAFTRPHFYYRGFYEKQLRKPVPREVSVSGLLFSFDPNDLSPGAVRLLWTCGD